MVSYEPNQDINKRSGYENKTERRKSLMTETEVAVTIAEHGKEIGSLKHRMDEQEAQNKIIQDLILSVQKLAFNMESMLKEQTRQGDRLQKLESEPADNWKETKRTIITSVISTLAGAASTGLIVLIAQSL